MLTFLAGALVFVFAANVTVKWLLNNAIPVEVRVENADYQGISLSNPWLWQVFLKAFDLNETSQFSYRIPQPKGGVVVQVNGINKIVVVLADQPQGYYKLVSDGQVLETYSLAYAADSKTLEIRSYWSEEGLAFFPGNLAQRLSNAAVKALSFVSLQAHGVNIIDGQEKVSDDLVAFNDQVINRYRPWSFVTLFRQTARQ